MPLILYTDLRGQLLHKHADCESDTTVPISASVPEGWQSSAQSDLMLIRDSAWRAMAPGRGTHAAFGNVVDGDGRIYPYCPRTVAARVEQFVRKMGFDEIRVGIELEFHVFDRMFVSTSAFENRLTIAGVDGAFHCGEGRGIRQLNGAARDSLLGTDAFKGLREDVAGRLRAAGILVSGHGHETGICQNEISFDGAGLVEAADAVQLAKWMIKEEAAQHGQHATFHPRPVSHDIGSGLHFNISLWRNGRNVLEGGASGYSESALHLAAGVLRHLGSLSAICNPMAGSYSRLMNCFPPTEAPTLGVGSRRSIIRLPQAEHGSRKRIEVRLPDPSCNPYLALSAVLLAMLEGRDGAALPLQWIDSSHAMVEPSVGAPGALPPSLHEAARQLELDHAFLTASACFDEDLIVRLASLARQSYFRTLRAPNPVEFALGFPI